MRRQMLNASLELRSLLNGSQPKRELATIATQLFGASAIGDVLTHNVPATRNLMGIRSDITPNQTAITQQQTRFATSSAAHKGAALRRLQRTAERAESKKAAVVKTQPQAVVTTPTEAPPSEIAVADVVNHPALVVARPVEWGTVLLGYEQANRYTIYDQNGAIVGHLLEDDGLMKTVGRQILRTRRPFTATVLSPDGNQIIFRLRRPMYLINSSMYIEDGEGNILGEVHQRWHLWRRNYDLYIDKQQFAAIEGGLLAWDFELKDASGQTLALIDRNFNGFGKELFTDAGKYVVHFGEAQEAAQEFLATAIHAQHPDKPPPDVTALARIRNRDLQVIPTSTGNQLVVHRPLQLEERMIALAAAISIDYNYFSRHSYGGGFLSPFVHPPIMPFPVPMGDSGAVPDDGTGDGTAGDGTAPPPPYTDEAAAASGSSDEQQPLERDLGGDSWGDDNNDDGDGDGGFGGGDDDEGGGFGGLFDGLKDLMGDWDQ